MGAAAPPARPAGSATLPFRPAGGYPEAPVRPPPASPRPSPTPSRMATAGAPSGSNLALRLFLGLLIVGLVVVLYFVTIVPAQRAEAAERQTDLTRLRMDDVRTGLIAYRDELGRYPGSLDSLVMFARTDSVFNARIASQEERIAPVSLDSLPYSPRTGNRFNYAVVRDTTGLEIYWLGDPDAEADSIGSRDPNPALRNAASWE